MNQKGEITLLASILILCLVSIVLLSALELSRSYRALEKRTHLFLCVKETKGELHHLMKFMGRSNWGIKNLNRAALIMMFIPGGQGLSMNTQKLKKFIQRSQEVRLISYLASLKKLQSKKCALDPRMVKTPFKLGPELAQRDKEGALILREKKWSYGFFSKPYFINLKVEAANWEKITPKIHYISEEKMARLSSHLF